MNESTECPAERVLLDYVARRLDATTRGQIDDHLAGCDTCKEVVSSAEDTLLRPSEDEESDRSRGMGLLATTEELGAHASGVVASAEARFDFDLLEPPKKKKSLGRLGNYEIEEVVGHGGMGIVFRAYDERLRRKVAIKALTRELASSATARRRFIREARAAAAVNHPNVVTIHAVEDHADQPFLVMEYLGDGSLRDRLRQERQLDPIEAIRLSAQIASGLAAAHAQGVIHRDVKPGNIMLEKGLERVRITDFGLARVAIDNVELTSRGLAVGTPAYMAPEQVAGEKVDSRTDLFALGCVIYAMLGGHSPFHGKHALDTAQKVTQYDPPDLHKVNERTPLFLSEIVMRLLQKDPNHRYQSAMEVANELNEHIAIINQTPTDELGTVIYSRGKTSKPKARMPWKVAQVVVLVLIAIGLVPILQRRDFFRSEQQPVLSQDGSFKRAASEDGEIASFFPENTSWVQAVALSPDGSRALSAGGEDTAILIWDLRQGRVLRRLEGHSSWVWAAAFSPDGSRVLSGGGGSWKTVDGARLGGTDFTVRLWDVETGRQIECFEEHTDTVLGVAFSADGQHVISCSRDSTILLRSLDTPQIVRRFEVHQAEVMAVAIAPDGSKILSGSWDVACLSDTENGDVIHTLYGHEGPVVSVAFSPNGQYALTGCDDRTVRLWSVETGRELRRFEGHDGRVSSVAFSSDGHRVLSGGDDKMVRLWDFETGKEIGRFEMHEKAVNCVAFSHDGRCAISGSGDASIRLWRLPKSESSQ